MDPIPIGPREFAALPSAPRVTVKRVEEIFGWTKTVVGGRKLRYVGQKRNEMWMLLTVATYNVVRMANLELAAA